MDNIKHFCITKKQPETFNSMNSLQTPRSHIRQDALITAAYNERRGQIEGYILKRIGCKAIAEDLTHEVFLRLLEQTTLLTSQTLVALIYTIARNLVIDHMRRHACSRRAKAYFAEHAPRSTYNTEQMVHCNELEAIEQRSLARMSPRKAEVYLLYIHENRTLEEISTQLGLSRRTVENHIFAARIDVREAMRYAL